MPGEAAVPWRRLALFLVLVSELMDFAFGDAMLCTSMRAFVKCCIGTMPRVMLRSPLVVLWLLFLFVPTVNGVCNSCFGASPGCAGTSQNCPWVTVFAKNGM